VLFGSICLFSSVLLTAVTLQRRREVTENWIVQLFKLLGVNRSARTKFDDKVLDGANENLIDTCGTHVSLESLQLERV
jgi:hypothetical protein